MDQASTLEGHRLALWNAIYALYKFEDMYERFGVVGANPKSTALPTKKDVWIHPQEDGSLKVVLVGTVSKHTDQCATHEAMAERLTAANIQCQLAARNSLGDDRVGAYRPKIPSYKYELQTIDTLKSLGWNEKRRPNGKDHSFLTITLPDSEAAVETMRQYFMELVPAIIKDRAKYWSLEEAKTYEGFANDLLHKYIDPNAEPFCIAETSARQVTLENLQRTLEEASRSGWLSTQKTSAAPAPSPTGAKAHEGTVLAAPKRAKGST